MLFVLVTVALITSTAVGYVYKVTKDPIKVAKQEKIVNALKEVVPANDTTEEIGKVKVYPADSEDVTIYKALKDGKTVGYAVETYTANGYSGIIKLLVGFDSAKTINKVAVISHSETPGLGAKIEEAGLPFVVQFEGKSPENFNMKVKADGGNLDAITASTITSRAYAEAMQRAYDAIVKL